MPKAKRSRKTRSTTAAGGAHAGFPPLPEEIAENYVPAKVLAELLGVTEGHVYGLSSRGVIPRPDGPGRFPLAACLVAYARHLRTSRRPADPEVARYRISLEREKALKERLLRRRLEGELVPLSTVARLLGDLAAAWRDELEAAPARLGPRLAAEHDLEERAATRLLEEAVRELRERSAAAMERVATAYQRLPAQELYGEDVDLGEGGEDAGA